VIRRLLFGVGVGALGLGGVLLACNAVLGIGSASPDPDGAPAVASESVSFKNDPCGTYCAVVEKNCTGPYLEYLGPDPGVDASDVCLTLCQVRTTPAGEYRPFPGPNPPVEQEPPSEDTLGCRLWHAHKAQGDPATHCRHAGPLGSAACCTVPAGATECPQRPCEPFCELDMQYCGGDRPGAVYGGGSSPLRCQSVCSDDAGFEYVEGPQDGSADAGASFDLVDEYGVDWEMGDTLNCRLWHLEKAIASTASDKHADGMNAHCGHTDQDGGGMCFGSHPSP
jgi:hypothetical protein